MVFAATRRWTFPDGRGEIGIIAPVSEPFCGHCNRIRLTADGKIRTCVADAQGGRSWSRCTAR